MSISKAISAYVNQVDNQKKINRILLSIVVGIVVLQFGLRAMQLLPEHPLFFITSDAFEISLACGLALIIYYVIYPSKSLKSKFIGYLFCFVILLVLAYLKDFRRAGNYSVIWSEFLSYIGMIFIFTSMFYVFDNLNLLINNSYVKTKEALRQAENKLLRQQFNPHFLYNAFNSLYSMSLSNNPKTPESILRMSGMMRYITDEVEVAKTPISRELKFIEDYVKIEQLRFGEEANIRFEVKGSLENVFIEPLLLITLVENAFKHGFYTNNPSSFVHIISEVSPQIIHFKVSNSISNMQDFLSEKREGRGLDLLQKRLELSYGNTGVLNIQKNEDGFMADLKIKM